MKNILTLLFAFLIVTSCEKEKVILPNHTPNAIKGYHIFGNLKVTDNQTVYLQELSLNKKYTTLKTTQIKNNNFEFSGPVNREKIYYIAFKDSIEKLPIIINDFETIVTINALNINKSTVLGSPLQTELSKYSLGLNKAKNKFVYKLHYIKNNASSSLSPLVLEQMLGKTKWRLAQNRKAYNYLTNKNTTLAKTIAVFLKEHEPKVAKEKSIAELSLDPKISDAVPFKIIAKKKAAVIRPYRKKAPNFYAEGVNGNDASLKALSRGKKAVLIDFWASWCGPCRNQNPHLKKLYAKYHKAGFEIIGVSEDEFSDKTKWKNAIANDGLSWVQLLDDDARIATMYGVKGIPHNVLLDKRGGIILNKKSTYTVEAELKKIFGF